MSLDSIYITCDTRNHSAQVREFLEKHFVETSGHDTIKLAVKSLMETVEAGSKSLEVAVMEKVGVDVGVGVKRAD